MRKNVTVLDTRPERRPSRSEAFKAMRRLNRTVSGKLEETGSGANESRSSEDEDPILPRLRDGEGFITFRFKKDGGFDVVKDRVSSVDDEIPARPSLRSKPVNRKLNYEESGKRVVIESSFSNGESEEKEESVAEHRRVKSGESTQSSNASSGSFAFPVLDWERIGSPEKMPKSEGLRIGKHRPCFAAFQCCRF